MPTHSLTCDGCGQAATPKHIARRLQRLESTTRYRPVHMGSLLLGGMSPLADADFLYAGKFDGEAGRVLEALGISVTGKGAETVLNEFQRRGFFLTHVLECPLDPVLSGSPAYESLLSQRIPAVMARIRRSLKPKRVVLISESLTPFTLKLTSAELECPVLLDGGEAFGLDSKSFSGAAQRLQVALATVTSTK